MEADDVLKNVPRLVQIAGVAFTAASNKTYKEIDIPQLDLIKWLRQAVDHLVTNRNLSVSASMRAKFILARKLGEKIATARQIERNRVYARPNGLQSNGLLNATSGG
jgi:hypothetical protein